LASTASGATPDAIAELAGATRGAAVAWLSRDAIVVALVLRVALRAGGPELVREHGPGLPATLHIVLRLVFRNRDNL
jgi:hypothetical protein